jgi:hypothetical protein
MLRLTDVFFAVLLIVENCFAQGTMKRLNARTFRFKKSIALPRSNCGEQ